MAIWLITWEVVKPTTRIRETERIAAMLNYRYGPEYVKVVVEALYANRILGLEASLSVARKLKKKRRADSYAFYNGFQGQILTCGDPHLFARLVENPRVVLDQGVEKLLWDERPYPANVAEHLAQERENA